LHNNFYFLRQLTVALSKRLIGTVVSECFSQNKDELIIRLETNASPFFIKASLSPSFSCLSFPDSFHRAKKNSVDLFNEAIGQRIKAISTFENERSFVLRFNDDTELLFKMHGNRSNIILFKNGIVTELFKNQMTEDAAISLVTLHRAIDWRYEHFETHRDKPESIYFTFGKIVWTYLRTQNYDALSDEKKWHAINNVRNQLEQPTFSIRELNGKVFFSLLEVGDLIPNKKFSDPIEGVNEFFSFYTQHEAFIREKTAIISALRSRLHAAENYRQKTQNKLDEIQRDTNYKTWADLLMANLHTISTGTERITLSNFYLDNLPTEIKLKRELSPQKNAAVFYKKSKNQQIEINHLQQLIESKAQERDVLLAQLQLIEAAGDLRALRKLSDQRPRIKEKEKQPIPVPYREVSYNGFKIWIGKNAQHNDTLTLKYSYKDDLWLHAKDVAGSHVLIKHQAGKVFPKDVIERAAQLAAYYSKRKNETLCPVSVTQKKYVRKRKGDPAGAVVVEREEVVMVEPLGDG